MLFFEKYELDEDFKSNKKVDNINIDKCNYDESESNDMSKRCNHTYGYIHHLPKIYKIIKIPDYIDELSRHKLCGYVLSPKSLVLIIVKKANHRANYNY